MAGVGMEVLFCATQNQIKSRDDAIVCAVHWNMISNGFGCIGTGEDVRYIKFVNVTLSCV